MSIHQPKLFEIVRRDPRYAYEAYEFIFAALDHTLGRLGKRGEESAEEGNARHVSGPELLEGVRDLALREFGLMARTVFRQWGINRTDDFGEIVFNLIEAELMSKTPEDNRADFQGVYDLDEALVQGFRLELPDNFMDAELSS
jgi:uncharacterized repeat protein (TIGR04138 family)